MSTTENSKPPRIWPMIAAALIGPAVAAIALLYFMSGQLGELRNTVGAQGNKIDALTMLVHQTKETAATVKTTLDEGIRQSLTNHDRRLTQQEEFTRRQAEIMSEIRIVMTAMQAQLEALRRTSDIDLKSSPGRR